MQRPVPHAVRVSVAQLLFLENSRSSIRIYIRCDLVHQFSQVVHKVIVDFLLFSQSIEVTMLQPFSIFIGIINLDNNSLQQLDVKSFPPHLHSSIIHSTLHSTTCSKDKIYRNTKKKSVNIQ